MSGVVVHNRDVPTNWLSWHGLIVRSAREGQDRGRQRSDAGQKRPQACRQGRPARSELAYGSNALPDVFFARSHSGRHGVAAGLIKYQCARRVGARTRDEGDRAESTLHQRCRASALMQVGRRLISEGRRRRRIIQFENHQSRSQDHRFTHTRHEDVRTASRALGCTVAVLVSGHWD
jgi:hypothetical protein